MKLSKLSETKYHFSFNRGYNPVCFSDELDEKQLLSLLEYLGKTIVVKEEALEAHAVVSATLTTFFWFLWDEVSKIGIEFGLKRAR